MLNAIRDFLKLETASGVILVIAAILAMVVANSPLASIYATLIDLPVEVRIGTFEIAKPLLLWINDGLMAIFFFLIGLELKREVLEGELSDPKEVVLPALGALGGMVIPAAIYVGFNFEDDIAIQGWAIPAATDIAFALAILALLGERVQLQNLPVSRRTGSDLRYSRLFYCHNIARSRRSDAVIVEPHA